MVEIDFPNYGVSEMETNAYVGNNRLCISFGDPWKGPLITLTVNLPDDHLEPGEFFVKTWSENTHLRQTIINSGIFIDTGRRVRTGFVQAEVWRFADSYAYLHKGGV